LVVRTRYFLASASAALFFRMVAGCSTAAHPAETPEAGPPGEAFTACQIQGYISESEGGLCPEGTCPALAFDTNGGRIPCCTSIASGPAMCVDAGEPDALDGAAPDAEPEEGGDAADADGGADGGSGVEASAEAATDGPAEAGADASPDAADQ
jgi:hypothetical protein